MVQMVAIQGMATNLVMRESLPDMIPCIQEYGKLTR